VSRVYRIRAYVAIATLNDDKIVDEPFVDQIPINPEMAKSDVKR